MDIGGREDRGEFRVAAKFFSRVRSRVLRAAPRATYRRPVAPVTNGRETGLRPAADDRNGNARKRQSGENKVGTVADEGVRGGNAASRPHIVAQK